jgi:Zn finger protein HypA/HybF involved in hydrogenase expression
MPLSCRSISVKGRATASEGSQKRDLTCTTTTTFAAAMSRDVAKRRKRGREKQTKGEKLKLNRTRFSKLAVALPQETTVTGVVVEFGQLCWIKPNTVHKCGALFLLQTSIQDNHSSLKFLPGCMSDINLPHMLRTTFPVGECKPLCSRVHVEYLHDTSLAIRSERRYRQSISSSRGNPLYQLQIAF